MYLINTVLLNKVMKRGGGHGSCRHRRLGLMASTCLCYSSDGNVTGEGVRLHLLIHLFAGMCRTEWHAARRQETNCTAGKCWGQECTECEYMLRQEMQIPIQK